MTPHQAFVKEAAEKRGFKVTACKGERRTILIQKLGLSTFISTITELYFFDISTGEA